MQQAADQVLSGAQATDTTASLAKKVHELAKTHGVARTAKLLGLSRQAVATIAAGLETKPGTRALAREGLRLHCVRAEHAPTSEPPRSAA